MWLFSLPVKASMVAAVLCCLPLLAATVMLYSVPGSRSVRVVVVTSLGTVSWSRKAQLNSYLTGFLQKLCDRFIIKGHNLAHPYKDECRYIYVNLCALCCIYYPFNIHLSYSLPQKWPQRRMCRWPCNGRWGPGPRPTPEWWCCLWKPSPLDPWEHPDLIDEEQDFSKHKACHREKKVNTNTYH